MPFKGHIPPPSGPVLTGWAVDEYGAPCEVAVSVGGGAPALVMSDRARTDLLEAGISTGQGGFQIDISSMLAPGDNEVTLTLPDGSALNGSPVTIAGDAKPAAPLKYRGWIDSPDTNSVLGWALDNHGLPCRITADVNGLEQVSAESDNPRPDLVRGGVSKGLGGFVLPIGDKLREGTNRISVRFPNGEHLPGSPITRIVGDPEAFRPEPEAEPVPAPQPAPTAPQKVKAVAPQPSLTTTEEAPAAEATGLDNAAAAPAAPKPVPPDPPAKAPKPKKQPRPVADEAEKVASFPASARKKPALPSLAELDELSLDDLALAVAAGVISVPPPESSAPPPPDPDAAEPAEAEREVQPEPSRPSRGLLARLFGRR